MAEYEARRHEQHCQQIKDRIVQIVQEATNSYVAPPPPAPTLMTVQEAQQHLHDNIPAPAG